MYLFASSIFMLIILSKKLAKTLSKTIKVCVNSLVTNSSHSKKYITSKESF